MGLRSSLSLLFVAAFMSASLYAGTAPTQPLTACTPDINPWGHPSYCSCLADLKYNPQTGICEAPPLKDKLCADIAQTQSDFLWQYVDKDKMQDCGTDADCVSIGLVGFACGAIVNKTASAQNDQYRQSEFFSALDKKDGELKCPHYPPPCPYTGRPVCANSKCQGMIP